MEPFSISSARHIIILLACLLTTIGLAAYKLVMWLFKEPYRIRSAVRSLMLILCGPVYLTLTAQEAVDGKLQLVDSLIRHHLTTSHIPGMVVVLADRTGTLFAKGYGVREVGSGQPVDENTQFLIGSFSKTFTATTLGLLAAEGRLHWTDPILRYVPTFLTDNPYITEHATLRDLASMRVGWPNGDSLVFTVQDTDALLSYIRNRPVGEFRVTQGQAGNLSYALLGHVIEVTSGDSWFNTVRRRLLTPLAMNHTFASYVTSKATGNIAEGHAVRDGKVVPVFTEELPKPLAAAGGLTSTAADLGAWIQFQLGGRCINIDSATVDSVLGTIQRPYVLLGNLYQSVFQPPATIVGYGHGWVIYEDRGRRVLEHAGAWAGYTAFIALLPDDHVGFAILTNLSMDDALEDLRRLRTSLIRSLAPRFISR